MSFAAKSALTLALTWIIAAFVSILFGFANLGHVPVWLDWTINILWLGGFCIAAAVGFFAGLFAIWRR